MTSYFDGQMARLHGAGDLKQISAAMKMITDMKRIADHATNIAEWVIYAVTGRYRGERLQ